MGAGDRSDLKTLVLLLAAALALVVAVLVFAGPVFQEVTTAFSEGVGFKTAAIWSFFVTTSILIIFALVAGDSLIGELQFMLGSFFSFFILIWLLIAWVF